MLKAGSRWTHKCVLFFCFLCFNPLCLNNISLTKQEFIFLPQQEVRCHQQLVPCLSAPPALAGCFHSHGHRKVTTSSALSVHSSEEEKRGTCIGKAKTLPEIPNRSFLICHWPDICQCSHLQGEEAFQSVLTECIFVLLSPTICLCYMNKEGIGRQVTSSVCPFLLIPEKHISIFWQLFFPISFHS